MLSRIDIDKQEFFKALHIDELADFILQIECKYVEEKSLGDLMDEIDYSLFENVSYIDDVEFEVETLAELLEKHDIKFKIEVISDDE